MCRGFNGAWRLVRLDHVIDFHAQCQGGIHSYKFYTILRTKGQLTQLKLINVCVYAPAL